MGLDVSCSCNQICFRAGSYSEFDWWRTELAKKLGLDSGWIEEKVPFRYLLNHSDCDGFLTPRQCKQMIKPMQEFISRELHEMKNPWRIILGECSKKEQEYFLEKCRGWLNAFQHSAKQECELNFR